MLPCGPPTPHALRTDAPWEERARGERATALASARAPPSAPCVAVRVNAAYAGGHHTRSTSCSSSMTATPTLPWPVTASPSADTCTPHPAHTYFPDRECRAHAGGGRPSSPLPPRRSSRAARPAPRTGEWQGVRRSWMCRGAAAFVVAAAGYSAHMPPRVHVRVRRAHCGTAPQCHPHWHSRHVVCTPRRAPVQA